MTDIAAAALRPLGPSEAIGNDCVVPYYLDDSFADWSPALHRW